MNQLYARNRDANFWDKDRTNCNCGSFALNLTTWFTPYLDNELEEERMPECDYTEEARDCFIEDCLDEGLSEEEIIEELIEKDWEFILAVCPFLRPIKLKDARPGDRVIAYRLMLRTEEDSWGDRYISDQDFHFRVRIDGYWFEKCGSNSVVILRRGAEEGDWDYPSTHLCYTGPIKYAKFVEE